MKTIVFVILLPLIPLAAHAWGGSQGLPRHDLALGPAGGYIYDSTKGESGYSINFDMSYTILMFTPSINWKYMHLAGGDYYGLQPEFTLWYGVNIGGGAGYLWGENPGMIYHFFVGFPAGGPFYSVNLSPFQSYYVEFYYRLNYFHESWLHEFGVMVKITTFKIPERI